MIHCYKCDGLPLMRCKMSNNNRSHSHDDTTWNEKRNNKIYYVSTLCDRLYIEPMAALALAQLYNELESECSMVVFAWNVWKIECSSHLLSRTPILRAAVPSFLSSFVSPLILASRNVLIEFLCNFGIAIANSSRSGFSGEWRYLVFQQQLVQRLIQSNFGENGKQKPASKQ